MARDQEIDQRNGAYPTTRVFGRDDVRHWDDFRAGKRQHLFRVDIATGKATDLTPVDHDVPAIATSGDGDVTVSPDGKDILVAMHADSTVADNTNVDIYAIDARICTRSHESGCRQHTEFSPTTDGRRSSRWSAPVSKPTACG